MPQYEVNKRTRVHGATKPPAARHTTARPSLPRSTRHFDMGRDVRHLLSSEEGEKPVLRKRWRNVIYNKVHGRQDKPPIAIAYSTEIRRSERVRTSTIIASAFFVRSQIYSLFSFVSTNQKYNVRADCTFLLWLQRVVNVPFTAF